MPPPVGVHVEEPRKPHPLSLVPLEDVYPDGAAGSELAAARKRSLLVPPLAHRRTARSPLEVRVRANIIALLDVNLVDQTFTCHFFFDATWVDTGFRGEAFGLDGPQTINAELSDQKKGWIITNEDTQHYFFSPQLRFRNMVSKANKLEEEYSVRYDTRGGEGGAVKPTVGYRVTGTATFHTQFELKNFPLDAQTFAIEVMSGWDKSHVRLKRNLREAARSVVCRDTFTLSNEYDLSGQVHLINCESDPRHSSSMTTYSYIEVQMHIRRKLNYWFLNVWLPLFWFTALSLASFLTEVTLVASRLSITLTVLLTIVSYRFSIMDKLPKIDYLTRLDKYVQLCFAMVFGVTVQHIYIAYRAEVELADELGNNWQQPSAWQDSQRTVMFWLAVAWGGSNVALLVVVFVMRRVQRSTEAMHWWDLRQNVLWIGPVNAATAARLSGSAVQRALDEAARLRRMRPITPPTRRRVGDEDNDEQGEEGEDASRERYAVKVGMMRVVTPAELAEHARSGMIPRTRQPFVLLELRSQAQAIEALKMLRESEATDAAALAAELAVEANAAAAALSSLGGSVGRQPSRRTSLLSSLADRAGPATLEEVLRALRLDDRRIVVEPAMPEYKHLLVGQDPTLKPAFSLAWWFAVAHHVAIPRHSSATMGRRPMELASSVGYRNDMTPQVTPAMHARRSIANLWDGALATFARFSVTGRRGTPESRGRTPESRGFTPDGRSGLGSRERGGGRPEERLSVTAMRPQSGHRGSTIDEGTTSDNDEL